MDQKIQKLKELAQHGILLHIIHQKKHEPLFTPIVGATLHTTDDILSKAKALAKEEVPGAMERVHKDKKADRGAVMEFNHSGELIGLIILNEPRDIKIINDWGFTLWSPIRSHNVVL